MADLSNEEIKFLRGLNAKIKGLGGQVTVTWKEGRIAKYDLTSTNSAEYIYKEMGVEVSSQQTVDLKD